MSDNLEVFDRGPVRWVVVDRYERRNAWTLTMGGQLDEILTDVEGDPSVRAIVVFGRNGCFSAGVDKSVFDGGTVVSTFPVERFIMFPKPTIACVDGLAFGMGTTMAIGCDLVVASTRATFTLGFAGIGLTPEWGATFLLWREIGWSRALDFMLTDRTMGAEEAAAVGLVNRLVAPEDVEDTAQALAEQIAALPAGVAEASKSVLWGALEQLSLTGARAVEMRTMLERRLAMDAAGIKPGKQ